MDISLSSLPASLCLYLVPKREDNFNIPSSQRILCKLSRYDDYLTTEKTLFYSFSCNAKPR